MSHVSLILTISGLHMEEMFQAMRAMDDELRGTDVANSLPINHDGEIDEGALDANLVQNFLSSYKGQGADAGPVSNFLNTFLKKNSLKDLEGLGGDDEDD